MSKLKFKVTQGIIHVNSIRVLQCTEEALCFSVDFKQKYPEYLGYNEKDLIFSFNAGEHTIGVNDKEADPTDIVIVNPPFKRGSKVHVSVDMGRYSAIVFVVQEADDLNRF
jgi:hypothetical protein